MRYKLTDARLFSECIEADSMQEAMAHAVDWCRQGGWNPSGKRVTVEVVEYDENGRQTDIQYLEVEPDPFRSLAQAIATSLIDAVESCDYDEVLTELDNHDWVEESRIDGIDGVVTFRCRECEMRRVETPDGFVIRCQWGKGETK